MYCTQFAETLFLFCKSYNVDIVTAIKTTLREWKQLGGTMHDYYTRLYLFCKIALITLFMYQVQSCSEQGRASHNEGHDTDYNMITFSDEDSHYRVEIDYRSGKTAAEMGAALGAMYRDSIPNFESLGDAYLHYMFGADEQTVEKCMEGVALAKSRLTTSFLDELEAAASQMSATEDSFGDGKLSPNEYLLFNLEPDMGFLTLCSGMGVNPSRSFTGKTLAIRAVDWPITSIVKLQTVLVRKYDSVQTVGIGYAGLHNGVTTVNSHGVMVSSYMLLETDNNIIDAEDSFVEHMKEAIEGSKTAEMLTEEVQGVFASHVLLMANDREKTLVVESDRVAGGSVRSEESTLQRDVEWDIAHCVPVVNTFLLEGKENSYDDPQNNARLASMKMMTEKAIDESSESGEKITVAELQAIFSYYSEDAPGLMAKGDLYNGWTQQVITYDAANQELSAWFIAKDGKHDTHLSFEKIALPWNE